MNKRARKEVSSVKGTAAAAVAASFALPAEFQPFRMRNEYSTEETALFKVFEEHRPYPAGGLGGTNEQLRDDTHLEMIFQDMLLNRISYVRNPASASWVYNWRFGRSVTGVDNNTYSVGASLDEELVPTHATAVNPFAPHGPVYFAESDERHTGMWVDDGPIAHSVIQVTLGTSPTGTGGRISLIRFNNGVWTEANALSITAGTTVYSFTLATSDIYAIRVERAIDTQTVAVQVSGTCGCWGHLAAPYVTTNADSIEAVRALGHSILVRNTAAPLNQQGYISGVQPGKGRFYGSFLVYDGGTDIYPVVRDYNGASITRPLATGMYGFVKPTEEYDVSFRTPFTISNTSGSNLPKWTFAKTPICKTEYIVICFQCTTAAGRDFSIRTDTAGEFETSNQFFNVDKPRAEPQDWRDGMEALASFQQFYENPTHWKRILSTIGSIANVGGRILSLFGPKGAAVGVPMSMAGQLMQSGFQ